MAVTKPVQRNQSGRAGDVDAKATKNLEPIQIASRRREKTSGQHRNKGRRGEGLSEQWAGMAVGQTEWVSAGWAERKVRPEERRQGDEKKRKNTKARLRMRRNQEKALQMNLPYLVGLMTAACFALFICINYIHLHSELTTRMDTIKQLEQELEAQRSENDALETSINTYVDLDYVYKVATEELGMVYAGKDQVILYDKTESEYVKQDEDIPEY